MINFFWDYLSVFIALIETIGIMPFISVASDFKIMRFSILIVIQVLLIIFRGALNLFYLYMMSKFSKGRMHLDFLKII